MYNFMQWTKAIEGIEMVKEGSMESRKAGSENISAQAAHQAERRRDRKELSL
jgi:hypothetical protein